MTTHIESYVLTETIREGSDMSIGVTAFILGVGTTVIGLGSATILVVLFRRIVSKILPHALCLSPGLFTVCCFFISCRKV